MPSRVVEATSSGNDEQWKRPVEILCTAVFSVIFQIEVKQNLVQFCLHLQIENTFKLVYFTVLECTTVGIKW